MPTLDHSPQLWIRPSVAEHWILLDLLLHDRIPYQFASQIQQPLRGVIHRRCAGGCRDRSRLTSVPGVKAAFTGAHFHECVLQLDRPVAPVLAELARAGIHGGFDLSPHYPELGHALLVCATETKSAADLARYAKALGAALKKAA